MGRRSRSRSPKRVSDRRRPQSRERRREHRRSRSRSPRRKRSRSPRQRTPERRHDRGDRERRDWSRERRTSPEPASMSAKKKKNLPNSGQLYKRPTMDATAFIGKSEEEVQMMTLMGFGTFDTTKGKHVPGNDVGECHIQEKRRYRQYMNRRGGFNRPLDPIA